MKKLAARGSALLTTLTMIATILGLVAGLMLYASASRQRAINLSRGATRLSCAEAGLEFAKGYFGRNYNRWNEFLSKPNIYNPVAASYNPTPANYNDPQVRSHTELFADLDRDGNPDVYIYIRDNVDELPPVPANFAQDNDQNVIVGAVCISQTLAPRLGTGAVSSNPLIVESLLSYNGAAPTGPQALNGNGTGNVN